METEITIEKITEAQLGFGRKDETAQHIIIGTDFKGNTYRLAYWSNDELSWKLIKKFVEPKTEEK